VASPTLPAPAARTVLIESLRGEGVQLLSLHGPSLHTQEQVVASRRVLRSQPILFDPAQHPPGERQVETRQSVTSLLQASPVGCLLSLLPTPGCVQVHPGGRSKIVGQEIEQP